MKRVLKAILGPLWRATWPVRGPISVRLARRQQALMTAVIRQELQPHIQIGAAALQRIAGEAGQLAGLEQSINMARCVADAHAVDANLTLDSVVRELARLQRKVDELQDLVAELSAAREGLAVVGVPDGAGARMLAG